MLRRMLIGATMLVALIAAPAAAQYDFTASPGTVSPGGTVSFAGEGCRPFAEVTITLTQKTSTKAVGDSVTVATIEADANGEFSASFQVPAGTEAGVYLIEAFCGGKRVGFAEITVVLDSTVTTTPGSPSEPEGPLVRTGSDLNGLGLLGVGLLAVGGVILVATKSRRKHATS